jgi:predicted lipid carrier protein YhbT
MLAVMARPLPLLPLEMMVRQLVGNALAAQPSLAQRLADHAGATFAVDPIDCPFVILITVRDGRASVRLERDLTGAAYATRIAAPLLLLLGLLDGTYDGDALFFSRDLTIEGDTGAALALRNAIENAELQPADVVGVPDLLRAPVNRLTAILLEGLRRALDAPESSIAGGRKPAE